MGMRMSDKHERPVRRHGSGVPINATAAANYLDIHVKTLQKKTREGKILGFTGDDGPRRHWFYYICHLEDYRHKHCSQPGNSTIAKELNAEDIS
jgi:hypothetical protein